MLSKMAKSSSWSQILKRNVAELIQTNENDTSFLSQGPLWPCPRSLTQKAKKRDYTTTTPPTEALTKTNENDTSFSSQGPLWPCPRSLTQKGQEKSLNNTTPPQHQYDSTRKFHE